jgi:hypothetical protein
MFKDTISEATRRGGGYGTDPAVSRLVDIKPAETDVTPVERAARDAYAAELDARADAIPDPETSREMRARARRVQDALPIVEMFGRLREIGQAKNDLGQVSGLEGITLRAGLDASAQALRDSNPYPPLLLDLVQRFTDFGPDKALDACYLPVGASESDKASVAAAVSLLGLDAAKSTARPVSVQDRINRAVKAAVAPIRAEGDRLRNEIDDFKSVQAGKGARFQ